MLKQPLTTVCHTHIHTSNDPLTNGPCPPDMLSFVRSLTHTHTHTLLFSVLRTVSRTITPIRCSSIASDSAHFHFRTHAYTHAHTHSGLRSFNIHTPTTHNYWLFAMASSHSSAHAQKQVSHNIHHAKNSNNNCHNIRKNNNNSNKLFINSSKLAFNMHVNGVCSGNTVHAHTNAHGSNNHNNNTVPARTHVHTQTDTHTHTYTKTSKRTYEPLKLLCSRNMQKYRLTDADKQPHTTIDFKKDLVPRTIARREADAQSSNKCFGCWLRKPCCICAYVPCIQLKHRVFVFMHYKG